MLHRCRQSSLAARWLTNEEARTEVRFTLSLERGLVHGVVDYMGRGARWTVGISRLQNRPPREHRRGSTILPTAVGNLHPLLAEPSTRDQSEYRATLYFTDLDEARPVNFTPADLATARTRLDDLVAQLVENSGR